MKNENETFDITEMVVEKAFKILLNTCRLKGVKCDKIDFSFKRFEHLFIRKWKDLMYNEFPYSYNSNMAKCTDISARKIRDICNKR